MSETNGWRLERWSKRVQLQNCPIGLFECSGELCLKTEYGTNEGRIDAYIVSSGEFFWGGPMNIMAQRRVLVTPVQLFASPPPQQEAD